MKRLAIALLALASAGCSEVPFQRGDDDPFPFVCAPEHERPPCADGVVEGAAFPFALLTHCGVEWAYFDGRYWVPKPRVQTPSRWGNFASGTMLLERRDVAVFEGEDGGRVRFVPAARSYRPRTCA